MIKSASHTIYISLGVGFNFNRRQQDKEIHILESAIYGMHDDCSLTETLREGQSNPCKHPYCRPSVLALTPRARDAWTTWAARGQGSPVLRQVDY